jgi:hypothetical protein
MPWISSAEQSSGLAGAHQETDDASGQSALVARRSCPSASPHCWTLEIPRVRDKFVGNDRTNQPRRGEIFIDHVPRKWTELRRSVITPRWGSELQEGRRLSIKMPPLRGSIRVKLAQPASQEITHKFVARPDTNKSLTDIGKRRYMLTFASRHQVMAIPQDALF